MKSIVKLSMYFLVIAMYSCKSKSNKEVADSASSHQSQISTSMSDKTAITKESPLYTNIIFPGFIIKLHNFGIFGGHGIDGIIDSSQVNIQQDKNKYWNLTAKSDTIGLQAYDFNNIIELVARNKTDRFKISYHFKALLVKNHGGQIIGTSNDRILKDSLTYFFKLPESASNFQDIEQIIDKVSDVKKRFNLKDTIAKSEDGNEIGYRGLTVSYKNQVRQINTDDTIYLKIERFNNDNKLVETKYLKVEIFVVGDPDD